MASLSTCPHKKLNPKFLLVLILRYQVLYNYIVLQMLHWFLCWKYYQIQLNHTNGSSVFRYFLLQFKLTATRYNADELEGIYILDCKHIHYTIFLQRYSNLKWNGLAMCCYMYYACGTLFLNKNSWCLFQILLLCTLPLMELWMHDEFTTSISRTKQGIYLKKIIKNCPKSACLAWSHAKILLW